MKCAVHTDIDATGFCRNCGKALCAQCAREVHGALYCEECLARIVSAPQPVAAPPSGPNPGAAAVLGLVPGLGAIYNGEYVKGLIHFLIVAGVITALSNGMGSLEPLLGIFLAVFWVYMPIEAYRTAQAKRLGQPAPSFFSEPVPAPPGPPAASLEGEAGNPPAAPADLRPAYRRPMGAIVLIVLGILFLLGNFGFLDSLWLDRLWPLILVAVGAWLIWKRSR